MVLRSRRLRLGEIRGGDQAHHVSTTILLFNTGRDLRMVVETATAILFEIHMLQNGKYHSPQVLPDLIYCLENNSTATARSGSRVERPFKAVYGFTQIALVSLGNPTAREENSLVNVQREMLRSRALSRQS